MRPSLFDPRQPLQLDSTMRAKHNITPKRNARQQKPATRRHPHRDVADGVHAAARCTGAKAALALEGRLTSVLAEHTLTGHLVSPEKLDERASYTRRDPQKPQAPGSRRRRTLGRVRAGIRRENAQGGRQPRRGRVPAGAATHPRLAQADPGRARSAPHGHGSLLGPAIHQHSRPRDRDDAAHVVRAHGRTGPRLRRHLPDRWLEHSAHRRRCDAPRGHSRLQHRDLRFLQRTRRPADAGCRHSGSHAGRGARGARVRGEAARRKSLHVRQRRAPVAQAGQGRRP